MYPPILTRGKRVAVAEVGRALHTREKRTRGEESQMRSEESTRGKQEAERENTVKQQWSMHTTGKQGSRVDSHTVTNQARHAQESKDAQQKDK